MLTLEITVNGLTVNKYYICRVSGEPHERCHYVVYEGDKYLAHVWHNYDDGAHKLCERVLKKISEMATRKT